MHESSAKKALFLDRDGVINKDIGYAYQKEKSNSLTEYLSYALKPKTLGYLIIVVTNQSGIGRGYYTEDDFWLLMNWMKTILLKMVRQSMIYFFALITLLRE